jgi:hypothetical protein
VALGGHQRRLGRQRRISIRHRRIAEFLLLPLRNTDTLAQLASRALWRSNVRHAYRLDLLRGFVRFGLRMLFGRGRLGQTRSNRSHRAISFIATTRSCPELGFCDAGRISVTSIPHPRARFCDADCDVARLRIGPNDRFWASARWRSAWLSTKCERRRSPSISKASSAPVIIGAHRLTPHRANSHAGGHRFESCRAHHTFPENTD